MLFRSNLSFDRIGAKQLVANGDSLPALTSPSFTVTPGAPATLTLLASPTNAVAGVTLTPATRVQVQDAYGNLVPGSQDVLIFFNNAVEAIRPNPTKLRLVFDSETGLFFGSFVPTSQGRKLFGGILLPDKDKGGGFFLGTAPPGERESGAVRIVSPR